MRDNKINYMNHRVAFIQATNSGPEVGGDYTVVYECFCDMYDPTLKDVQFFDLTSSQHAVTLTIRNAYQEFKPEPHHLFKLLGGYFNGKIFEVISVAPYSDSQEYLKIIGKGT